MGELKADENGFSGVELIVGLVILALIGGVGFVVYKHHKAASTTAASSIKPVATTPAKTAAPAPSNPYAGWKTYHSILNSGLSFMYPPTSDSTPATQTSTPNNLGGVENDSVLYSVTPTTAHGQYAAVPTNQFMCVDFDEYSGNGWDKSNWNLGTPITSQQINVSGHNLTLATYTGTTPMQDKIVLFNPTDISSGDHFIDTNNGYVVSISAQFNCQQGGFPAGANLNADFNSQPEISTAKLIMESLKF